MNELDMLINALNCFGAGGDSPECPCVFRSDGIPCETKVAQKAQELLKKQIPKQAVKKKREIAGFLMEFVYCPTCGEQTAKGNYCVHCGQAMKWE